MKDQPEENPSMDIYGIPVKQMIKNHPKRYANIHIRRLLNWKDSDLIERLKSHFKSYSGYRYITMRKGIEDVSEQIHVQIIAHQTNPALDENVKVKSKQIAMFKIPKSEEHILPNVIINKKGLFVFNDEFMLNILEKHGDTVDDILQIYKVCTVCGKQVEESNPNCCVSCLSCVCEDCIDRMLDVKQCDTCLKEIDNG